ncbi:TPA: hypothetical protein ACGJTN_002749 [Pseudomonas aeruginosa]|nr:hypothetical protein [Pseudomonas aeruginosa]
MKRNANPAATVAAWNSAYPAGTEVDYRFVVWLAGVSGCVALSHCEPA